LLNERGYETYAQIMSDNKMQTLKVHAKINLHFRRTDLGQVWLIRLSEPAGIASYFEEFAIEDRPKMA